MKYIRVVKENQIKGKDMLFGEEKDQKVKAKVKMMLIRNSKESQFFQYATKYFPGIKSTY